MTFRPAAMRAHAFTHREWTSSPAHRGYKKYPVLRGTIRDYATERRRAYLRFFACGQDLSHEAPDALLPEEVAERREPFLVVGAMAGG